MTDQEKPVTDIQNELFDAWNDLRTEHEALDASYATFAQTVQDKYNLYYGKHSEDMKRIAMVLAFLERKKLNLEAEDRGKDLPFEIEDSAEEIIAHSKQILERVKQANKLSLEQRVAGLFSTFVEDKPLNGKSDELAPTNSDDDGVDMDV